MDAEDLRVFATVARLQGITKAAKNLNTVQSNVTARIKRLEDELGVILFNRHKKGVFLTSAGEQLIPYAEKVQQLLAEAKSIFHGTCVQSGTLRIGSLETTTALRLSPLLAEYGKLYPQIDLTLITHNSQQLVQDVLDYKIEGAFVIGPIEHSQLTAIPVFEEKLAFYTPIRVTDVEKYVRTEKPKIFVFRSGCVYRMKTQTFINAWDSQVPRISELGSLDGILGCIGAGLGLSLLPLAIGEDRLWRSRWGKQIAVHPISKAEKVSTVFVRRSDSFTSSAMRSFIALFPKSSVERKNVCHKN